MEEMAIVTYETFYTGSECISLLASTRTQHFLNVTHSCTVSNKFRPKPCCWR